MDRTLLLAKLPGLEAAREKLEEEILDIRRTIWPKPAVNAGGRRPSAKGQRGGLNKVAPKKRGLTLAGRKRLSQLMKARWAERKATAAKKAPAKNAARKATA
jgi:hypothetical protein